MLELNTEMFQVYVAFMLTFWFRSAGQIDRSVTARYIQHSFVEENTKKIAVKFAELVHCTVLYLQYAKTLPVCAFCHVCVFLYCISYTDHNQTVNVIVQRQYMCILYIYKAHDTDFDQ